MIFKWILYGTFVVNFTGQDYDGKWNHLYDWKDQQGVPHHIAFRHIESIDPANVRAIKVECNGASGVDERASDRTNKWVTYKAFICNGFEVIMTDGEKVVVDKKLKEEAENPKSEKEYDFEEELRKNAEKKEKAAEKRRKANKGVFKRYKIK